MDNKVIEVLDYMGDKLGIAIDWTSANIMPQVTEFMERYKVYAVVKGSVWLLISIIVVLIAVCMLKKIVTQRNKMEGFWWDEDEIMVITTVVCCVAFFVCIITTVVNIFEIIKWSFIPEIQFFETFSEYLKSAS